MTVDPIAGQTAATLLLQPIACTLASTFESLDEEVKNQPKQLKDPNMKALFLMLNQMAIGEVLQTMEALQVVDVPLEQTARTINSMLSRIQEANRDFLQRCQNHDQKLQTERMAIDQIEAKLQASVLPSERFLSTVAGATGGVIGGAVAGAALTPEINALMGRGVAHELLVHGPTVEELTKLTQQANDNYDKFKDQRRIAHARSRDAKEKLARLKWPTDADAQRLQMGRRELNYKKFVDLGPQTRVAKQIRDHLWRQLSEEAGKVVSIAVKKLLPKMACAALGAACAGPVGAAVGFTVGLAMDSDSAQCPAPSNALENPDMVVL